MRVDEARRHGPIADIQLQRDLTARDDAEVADGEDPVAKDADVRAPTRGSGPIDDGPAAEEQVEAGHSAMVTRPTSPSDPVRVADQRATRRERDPSGD